MITAMAADTSEIMAEALAAADTGPPVLVATVISGPDGGVRPGAKMLVRVDGSTAGSLDGGRIDAAVQSAAPAVFKQHEVQTLILSADGKPAGRNEEEQAYRVMIEPYEPSSRLLIIGGGHVGMALARIGHLCAFSIEIVDDRPEFASAERFPEADRITRGRFDEVLGDYPIDQNTYVVCVTRGHKHDETSLRCVVESSAAYVGMIGSKRRVRAVLQHLVEEGIPADAAERVHTPIGLDIGAETPEEIAVSIMAEIIQSRRGGTGASMRRTNRLPRP